MAEKDKVFTGKIKESGFFDFKEFYSFLYDWLAGEDYDTIEEEYKEALSGESKNIDIKWTSSKNLSDYFKSEIKIEWKIIGMKSVEAQREGKKIKLNKGDIELKFKGTLIRDRETKWEDSPFIKFLRTIYDKYIIKDKIEEMADKVKSDTRDCIDQCKAFMYMESKK